MASLPIFKKVIMIPKPREVLERCMCVRALVFVLAPELFSRLRRGNKNYVRDCQCMVSVCRGRGRRGGGGGKGGGMGGWMRCPVLPTAPARQCGRRSMTASEGCWHQHEVQNRGLGW
jgi:hypothetical protein